MDAMARAVIRASAPASSSSGCKMGITSHGAYQDDNPIDFALPLLMVQMCIVLALTRSLAIVMKPLRQPRVVAEIIGGILLGPSAFGRNQSYINKIFPSRSITVLETFANLGLIFFLFMVGLELDLTAVMRTGRQALVIAAAGITTPFATGVGVSVVLRNTISKEGKFSAFLVFMGVAMSITAFPVLARILAERKLLTTDVGQIAMSAAAVNDVVAWILLALAVALSGTDTSPTVAIWVLLTGLAYLVIMFTVVRRFMTWVAHHVTENEPVKELYVCITFAGVLASAFATDVIGIHSIFGAFVFGLIIPKDGPLAKIVIEKVEDFVIVLMLPLYFVSSGLKTNIQSIHGAKSGGLTVLVIASACLGKIVGTFVPAVVYGINARKAMTLGFLMNTKGLVELIVLNIGKERGVLNEETFAIMVIMALFTTFITTPIVMALYKPARTPIPYTLRKLEMCTVNDELRVVACVHGIKNVPGIISLVDQARGRSRHSMRLYILHLVELSERSSAIVMVHTARRNGRLTKSARGENHIYVAFEAFGHLSEVKVRPMTVVSNFSDMHDDICATAADKRAAVLILPFHKIRRADGVLETLNTGFQFVNDQVLQHAPCSVGIFIDRGLSDVYHAPVQLVPKSVSHSVAVFFFGGPDDREALAMGCRMAEHPGVKVKVIHFLSCSDGELVTHRKSIVISTRKTSRKSIFQREGEQHHYHVDLEGVDFEKEKQIDIDTIAALREEDKQGILYEQVPVGDPIDAVMDTVRNCEYNLVIVGRARVPCRLIASLNNLALEYEELGPIGSVLASSDPSIKASVLVMQQYTNKNEPVNPVHPTPITSPEVP
ncbi:cation/H(+) antiporter 18 [Selaginella moellendorffii]|uniref:cation/H(+) antiporter 18 n=1 Tax=Selaginella moellendorffii TaxID=88036 RepID=UPI000D1CA2A8|nr:cation/H(+) antiporter 18 [Selaginella moellendorffii]|eukprot:XP_024520981.1 cation/H(+) antiporter 18 [Selaginella moellendorffii]